MNNIAYAYTLVSGVIPDVVRRVIEHNKWICKENGIEFKVEHFDVLYGECAAGKSDKERFKKASQTARILYVDWDCKIENLPEFDPEKPMVYQFPNSIVRESFVIYNGDNVQVFKDIYPIIKKTSIKRGWWGCHLEALNSKEFRNKMSAFPDGCFTHLNIHSGKEIK
jgi:hypothetical protein